MWSSQSSALTSKFKSNLETLLSDSGDEPKQAATVDQDAVSELCTQSQPTTIVNLSSSPHNQSSPVLDSDDTADVHEDESASVIPPSTVVTSPPLSAAENKHSPQLDGISDVAGEDYVEPENESETEEADRITSPNEESSDDLEILAEGSMKSEDDDSVCL